jgi:two-component system nitrogen regulation response regulator NtrX
MSAARILVVDDEADIRGLLKEILSEEGYEVEVAANAAQARASRARQTPDLVLLDIWMPDVDGITLLREWSAVQRRRRAGGDDVRARHGRDRGGGDAPGRLRLRRKAPVASPSCCAPWSAPSKPASASASPAGRMAPPLQMPAGKSRVMQQLRTQLQQMATHSSAVLLIGESGSGREACARYLHAAEPRSRRALRHADRQRAARGGRELTLLLGSGEPKGLLEAGRRRLAVSSMKSRTCRRSRSAY